MKKDEIKSAYEELNFSENLQNEFFYSITSGESSGRKRKKFSPALALICILLAGTTIYAAERLDWFHWYYGEDYSLISDKTDSKIYSTENGRLKMSVENAVFTKESGVVFVHIQALDEKSREFMEQNAEFLSIEFAAETKEVQNEGGSGESSSFCKELSDEENWYYILRTVNHKTSEFPDYDTAKICFPASYQESYGKNVAVLSPMELEFPVTQTIGTAYVYKECGKFQEVSVSPLTVTVAWGEPEEATETVQNVEKLEIVMKDGNVLTYEKSNVPLLSEWESCQKTTGSGGRTVLTLVPKKLLDVEKIETVAVNGVVCK